MAKTLATRLTLQVAHDHVNTVDLSEITDKFAKNFSDLLANGTGDDQADLVWHDQRTLDTTAEDIDLAGVLTALVDGSTITFAKIKGILIVNTSTTTAQNIVVGGKAANAFVNWVSNATDEIVIGPKGIFLLWSPMDGYAVTAGTGDILEITTNANITYKIWIVGTSA